METLTKLSPRARNIAVAIIMLATTMELLDTTIVNIAIPTIQQSFSATYSWIQWVLVGYTLAFAVLLIAGGRLGDIFGYKKLFMIGVGGFGLTSLLGGVTPNIELLVAFRVVQGVFAAMMVPQTTSLIQLMYTGVERAKVLGLLGALAALAAAFGPLVGGALLHADIAGLSWRPLFFVNVPLAIATIIAGYYLLPSGKSHHPLKLDSLGTLLVTTALGLLVLPLVQGPDLHWPLWTRLTLLSSLPAMAAFIVYEFIRSRRGHTALIELPLFRQETFTKGLLLSAAFQIAMGGVLLTYTYMLQKGLGYDALKAALGIVPLILGVIPAVALVGQRLLPIIGRYVITLGSLVMATGLGVTAWLFSHYGMGVSLWQLAPATFFTGTGMGLITFPLFAVTLQHVEKGHVGSASGVLESVQQLGSVFGVVLIGTAFFDHLVHGFSSAFTLAMELCIVALGAVTLISLILPRRFKAEEELDLA